MSSPHRKRASPRADSSARGAATCLEEVGYHARSAVQRRRGRGVPVSRRGSQCRVPRGIAAVARVPVRSRGPSSSAAPPQMRRAPRFQSMVPLRRRCLRFASRSLASAGVVVLRVVLLYGAEQICLTRGSLSWIPGRIRSVESSRPRLGGSGILCGLPASGRGDGGTATRPRLSSGGDWLGKR